MPLLVVQRAQPEGVEEKTTKSGRTRRVPVADRILRGVDAITVQAWMGHASTATTNIYLHPLGTAPTGPGSTA